MAPDEYQRLKQAFHDNVVFQGMLREEKVANYFRQRNYEVLSEDDDRTRSVFGIPKAQPAADIVARKAHRAIIAEVKGQNNLDYALHQLSATVGPVRAHFPFVECKVFTALPPPSGDSVMLRGGGQCLTERLSRGETVPLRISRRMATVPHQL